MSNTTKLAKNYINIGLIGCGRISDKHVAAVSHIRNTRIIAVCDIDAEKAEKLAAKLSISKIYKNYKDIINDKDVDVINICTPSGLHSMMAIEAFRQGKDVIIEKPISLTVTEAKKVIKSAKKYDRILLPVMQNRFNPAITFLKNNSDKLGKINFIEAACFWYRPQDYYNDGWHGTKKMDGGVLMNQGIHYVDMIYYLLGSLPKEVSALGGTYGHKMECEDVISLNIKFKNNVIASLRANTISYPENFEGSITIFFEKATVKIGGKAMNQIISWKGEGEDLAKEFNNSQSDDIYGGGHLEVIKNMCDIKNDIAKPYMSCSDAMVSIKIIEAAYKSIAKNKNIKI
jgi:UDP-N-acetyl-2-amino-2-deoxyglucuronate dehydrogenase